MLPMAPGTSNELSFSRYVNVDKPARSITTALVPTDDKQLDKKDGTTDGLTPLEGFKTSEVAVDKAGHVDTTIAMDIPQDADVVYLLNRIVGEKKTDMVAPAMATAVAADVQMDAQASTENANSQLTPDSEQTIYNQAVLANLMPGKPYNIVAQLYQCGDGNCVEVAAVNREIIPQAAQSVQNFSVEVDSSQLGNNDTFEWALTAFEGTGDFDNMGRKLAEISDHPDNQVVSFTGTRGSHLAKQKETDKAAEVPVFSDEELSDDERRTGSADVEDARQSTSADYVISDNMPRANIDEVRKNNASLEDNTKATDPQKVAQDRADVKDRERSAMWSAVGAVAVVAVAAAGVAVWSRRSSHN